MYYLRDFCCICFSNTNDLQNIFNHGDDDITYNFKLTTTIPEMDMIDDRFICKKCCNDVDFFYKFREQCLRSKSTLANYIAQLDSGHIMKGYLRILLTDLGDKKKENDIIAQLKYIEKESVNCEFKHINLIETITDNFKQEINDVSCNVKLEGSNYEQDIKDDSVVNDNIESNEIVTKSSIIDSNVAYVCYNIKTEINDKLAHTTKYITSNQKYRVHDNVRNPNYEEEIGTEMINSHVNEANLCFDIIPEEIDIKTEYGNEKERDEEIIEDINTKIGSNISTDNSMVQIKSEVDPEKKLTVFFNSVFENNLTHDCSEPKQYTRGTKTLPSTDLMTHIGINLSKEEKKCQKDEKFTKLLEPTKHMKVHTGYISNDCCICDNKYSCSRDLKKHLLSHKIGKYYVCSICNKTFHYISFIKRHMQYHSGEKPHKCSTCNKKFVLLFDLKRHMLCHAEEKPYKCETCNKSFTTSYHFNKHMRFHTGESSFECSTCNKRFSSPATLKKHMFAHTGKKPRQCGVCHKRFEDLDNFTQHLKIHIGEKSYECSTCNKRFSTSSIRNRHMFIHTGEKPYECNICNKKFNVADALKKHILIHTGEKAYECITCNKRFSQSSHLKIHMLSHTGEKPYECNTCNKRFCSLRSLKRHMFIHSGKKPHECNICNMKFNVSVALKKHMLIHTGEKAYECVTCNKRFDQSSYLKKHMLSHTGEKP